MNEVLLKAVNLKKSYPQGAGRLEILRGVSLDVRAGEAVSIVGSSGAGKSTLMHLLGTLDRPDDGQLYFEGQDLRAMKDEELSHFRNQHMGFVFQFHHLLSEFTALENVMMPGRIAGLPLGELKTRAEEMLTRLGVQHRLEHYPSELSGGELQRVAIARALLLKPKILFADEPTGNLDSVNSLNIQNLFFDLLQSLKIALIVVTHDRAFAQRFPRCLEMKDGLWRTGHTLI